MGHIRPRSARREHGIDGGRVQYRRKVDRERVSPCLHSRIGFPLDSEPVGYLILDGCIAVVGFLGGGFDHFLGRFYRDGDVVHHIGKILAREALNPRNYNLQLVTIRGRTG
mgnify:CR=1 FL=1